MLLLINRNLTILCHVTSKTTIVLYNHLCHIYARTLCDAAHIAYTFVASYILSCTCLVVCRTHVVVCEAPFAYIYIYIYYSVCCEEGRRPSCVCSGVNSIPRTWWGYGFLGHTQRYKPHDDGWNVGEIRLCVCVFVMLCQVDRRRS